MGLAYWLAAIWVALNIGQSLRGCPALSILHTSCSGKQPNCSSLQLISQERHHQLLCRALSQ